MNKRQYIEIDELVINLSKDAFHTWLERSLASAVDCAYRYSKNEEVQAYCWNKIITDTARTTILTEIVMAESEMEDGKVPTEEYDYLIPRLSGLKQLLDGASNIEIPLKCRGCEIIFTYDSGSSWYFHFYKQPPLRMCPDCISEYEKEYEELFGERPNFKHS